MELDLNAVGKKVKEIYGVDGIAKDGRSYGQIPDEELGSLYLRKHGVDKAIATLGLENPEEKQKEEESKKKQSASLRSEYRKDPQTKSFLEVQKQWNNMQSAGETGGGDISIMYSYIKMLDPTTAVREGELALGDAAAGLPDKVVKAYNKAIKTKGAGLAPEQRKQFIAEGGKIYNNMAKEQQKLNAFYTGLAQDSGADPDSVVGTLKDIELADVLENKEEKEDLRDRGFFEKLFSTEATKQFLGEVPKYAVEGVGATGQNVLDLLKGDFESARQRSEEFKPKAERSRELFEATAFSPTGGAGELATKAEAVGGLQSVVGGIKGLLGIRGKLAGARNAASEGISFEKQNLKNAVTEALRLNPGAKKEGDLVLQQIDNARDVKDLFTLKDKFNKFGFTRGGGIKSSKAADFYATLSRFVGEEAARVAPEASKLHGLLRVSHQVPETVKKTATEGIRFGALGRILGL